MHKSTCISIVAPIMRLHNLSFSQVHVSADWKVSFIVPIPRCSSNLDNSSNYWPIFLLSSLAFYLKNIFTISFMNSVLNTTLSPILNLAFFRISPLHQLISLQITLFTLFYKKISVHVFSISKMPSTPFLSNHYFTCFPPCTSLLTSLTGYTPIFQLALIR